MLPTVRAELPAVTETLVARPGRRSRRAGQHEQVTPVGGLTRDRHLVGVTSTVRAPLSGGAPDARLVRLA